MVLYSAGLPYVLLCSHYPMPYAFELIIHSANQLILPQSKKGFPPTYILPEHADFLKSSLCKNMVFRSFRKGTLPCPALTLLLAGVGLLRPSSVKIRIPIGTRYVPFERHYHWLPATTTCCQLLLVGTSYRLVPKWTPSWAGHGSAIYQYLSTTLINVWVWHSISAF